LFLSLFFQSCPAGCDCTDSSTSSLSSKATLLVLTTVGGSLLFLVSVTTVVFVVFYRKRRHLSSSLSLLGIGKKNPSPLEFEEAFGENEYVESPFITKYEECALGSLLLSVSADTLSFSSGNPITVSKAGLWR
jgi:hypothetical protein